MRQKGGSLCIEFGEGLGISGMQGGEGELHFLKYVNNRRHSL